MRSKEENLNGLKYILAGLTLMAIAVAAVEIIFLFKAVTILNWAKMAVKAIAWVLIIIGLFFIKDVRTEFKRSLILSVIGILALGGSGLLAFMDYRAGLAEGAFLNIKVMFAVYIADLCMISIFYLLVRGMGQLVAKSGNKKLGAKSIRIARLAVIIILASMVITPFSYVWPTVVKIILGIISIGGGLLAELAMVVYANQAYKEIS